MRTFQHIIDTKAVRQVINAIPEYCVVRELTERDYGIDLMVELFAGAGEDKHGHRLYDSTGHVSYLQIKGTESEFKVNKDNVISYNIDKKSLLYVEKFSTPFILIRVCTRKSKEAIYFLWLQRYISDVLDIEMPGWRGERTESLTVYIPVHNDFTMNFAKIEKISYRIKFIEELAEYCEMYFSLQMGIDQVLKQGQKFSHFERLINEFRRVGQLETLMTKNYSCINKSCILEIIDYLNAVKDGYKIPNGADDFPHCYNLSHLSSTNTSTRLVESMVADNEGETTY